MGPSVQRFHLFGITATQMLVDAKPHQVIEPLAFER
jgi:hypothetical protein